jgi:hypothetical protein
MAHCKSEAVQGAVMERLASREDGREIAQAVVDRYDSALSVLDDLRGEEGELKRYLDAAWKNAQRESRMWEEVEAAL